MEANKLQSLKSFRGMTVAVPSYYFPEMNIGANSAPWGLCKQPTRERDVIPVASQTLFSGSS